MLISFAVYICLRVIWKVLKNSTYQLYTDFSLFIKYIFLLNIFFYNGIHFEKIFENRFYAYFFITNSKLNLS